MTGPRGFGSISIVFMILLFLAQLTWIWPVLYALGSAFYFGSFGTVLCRRLYRRVLLDLRDAPVLGSVLCSVLVSILGPMSVFGSCFGSDYGSGFGSGFGSEFSFGFDARLLALKVGQELLEPLFLGPRLLRATCLVLGCLVGRLSSTFTLLSSKMLSMDLILKV